MEQREDMNRGLVAVNTAKGIFLSWRLFRREADGYGPKGLTGPAFAIYRNGKKIAVVKHTTNFLDKDGSLKDTYQVEPEGQTSDPQAGKRASCRADRRSAPVPVWKSGKNYIDVPVKKPADGVTPAGERYTYSLNDMSVGDVNGDGEYEYIVKWYPSNAKDVSQKGWTGPTYLDCYTLSGQLLWRLDMGPNIRSGAHYTQFMVYDFNGDGKAEMTLVTAPGTKMTRFSADGSVKEESYITIPEADRKRNVRNSDRYAASAEEYREHLVSMFQTWPERPEVVSGQWPGTLEECFGIPVRYSYPLSRADAETLTDYFLDVYAPSRSPKNELRKFEGFIFRGPEYLSMFAGDGQELETIAYPFPRVDDGLAWGDYAMNRIEPCNRVDRFQAGVAYLDGQRPYLLVCRGYYTRTTIAAYDFFDGHFRETWKVDSGFVPMKNPFNDTPHIHIGSDPVYGRLAGQGDHSLSVADVDGDGKQELIYGAACIDHDGSLLYSSWGRLPDGTEAKFGHGDSMHVAHIDPDRPGFQIFNVFEAGKEAPYGYALRDAATGEVISDSSGRPFGVYCEKDMDRCMVGDIDSSEPGLECWCGGVVYNCRGEKRDIPFPSTDQAIRWAGDLSTQLIGPADWMDMHDRTGVISDPQHGVMLRPEGTLTNNYTKGNPCLVADLFGDFREEIVLRLADSSAFRIYMNTELTDFELYTPMDDTMYRTGIAWQNNVYNQTNYTSYYYAHDCDFSKIPLDDKEEER